MKRYDKEKESECIKCGGTDITLSFCDNPLKWHGDSEESHIDTEKEVIHRCCKNCGFRWNELPLDADAA